MLNIIFTDESSIQLTRDRKICWRKRGEYPYRSTYEKVGKVKKLIIWRGIRKFSFKIELFRVEGTGNAKVYIDFAGSIEKVFGKGYVFQQVNARPYTAIDVQLELYRRRN